MELKLKVKRVFSEKSDSTHYLLTSIVDKVMTSALSLPKPKGANRRSWWSWDGRVTLRTRNDGSNFISGRGNIAKCFGGKYCAITIRRDKRGSPSQNAIKRKSDIVEPNIAWARSHDKPQKESNGSNADSPGFAVCLKCICESLHQRLLSGEPHPSGLIVVAGSTHSAKSEIARGLIAEHLCSLSQKKSRNPHIVTLEDPIESLLWKSSTRGDNIAKNLEQLRAMGIDYTPREIGWEMDCPSVEAGLRDALRQTPTAVYVGETRTEKDWKAVIKFAGSGHLVITTAHAGSLLETFQRILTAVKARTPADFGIVAQCILGAVHVQAFHVDNPKILSSWVALLPAVWKRTPANTAKLVSDGLSSILPERPSHSIGAGTFGRTWFAEALVLKHADAENARLKNLKSRFALEALKSEIQGL